MDGNRATIAMAADLHGQVCELMLRILKQGEVVQIGKTDEGAPVYAQVTPSPAMIAQINAFLKNNGISVIPERSAPMRSLGDAFKDFAPPEDPEMRVPH